MMPVSFQAYRAHSWLERQQKWSGMSSTNTTTGEPQWNPPTDKDVNQAEPPKEGTYTITNKSGFNRELESIGISLNDQQLTRWQKVKSVVTAALKTSGIKPEDQSMLYLLCPYSHKWIRSHKFEDHGWSNKAPGMRVQINAGGVLNKYTRALQEKYEGQKFAHEVALNAGEQGDDVQYMKDWENGPHKCWSHGVKFVVRFWQLHPHLEYGELWCKVNEYAMKKYKQVNDVDNAIHSLIYKRRRSFTLEGLLNAFAHDSVKRVPNPKFPRDRSKDLNYRHCEDDATEAHVATAIYEYSAARYYIPALKDIRKYVQEFEKDPAEALKSANVRHEVMKSFTAWAVDTGKKVNRVESLPEEEAKVISCFLLEDTRYQDSSWFKQFTYLLSRLASKNPPMPKTKKIPVGERIKWSNCSDLNLFNKTKFEELHSGTNWEKLESTADPPVKPKSGKYLLQALQFWFRYPKAPFKDKDGNRRWNLQSKYIIALRQARRKSKTTSKNKARFRTWPANRNKPATLTIVRFNGYNSDIPNVDPKTYKGTDRWKFEGVPCCNWIGTIALMEADEGPAGITGDSDSDSEDEDVERKLRYRWMLPLAPGLIEDPKDPEYVGGQHILEAIFGHNEDYPLDMEDDDDYEKELRHNGTSWGKLADKDKSIDKLQAAVNKLADLRQQTMDDRQFKRVKLGSFEDDEDDYEALEGGHFTIRSVFVGTNQQWKAFWKLLTCCVDAYFDARKHIKILRDLESKKKTSESEKPPTYKQVSGVLTYQATGLGWIQKSSRMYVDLKSIADTLVTLGFAGSLNVQEVQQFACVWKSAGLHKPGKMGKTVQHYLTSYKCWLNPWFYPSLLMYTNLLFTAAIIHLLEDKHGKTKEKELKAAIQQAIPNASRQKELLKVFKTIFANFKKSVQKMSKGQRLDSLAFATGDVSQFGDGGLLAERMTQQTQQEKEQTTSVIERVQKKQKLLLYADEPKDEQNTDMPPVDVVDLVHGDEEGEGCQGDEEGEGCQGPLGLSPKEGETPTQVDATSTDQLGAANEGGTETQTAADGASRGQLQASQGETETQAGTN